MTPTSPHPILFVDNLCGHQIVPACASPMTDRLPIGHDPTTMFALNPSDSRHPIAIDLDTKTCDAISTWFWDPSFIGPLQRSPIWRWADRIAPLDFDGGPKRIHFIAIRVEGRWGCGSFIVTNPEALRPLPFFLFPTLDSVVSPTIFHIEVRLRPKTFAETVDFVAGVNRYRASVISDECRERFRSDELLQRLNNENAAADRRRVMNDWRTASTHPFHRGATLPVNLPNGPDGFLVLTRDPSDTGTSPARLYFPGPATITAGQSLERIVRWEELGHTFECRGSVGDVVSAMLVDK